MENDAPCSLEFINFHGWQAIILENGIVSLVVVPDIGGRIMAYNLDDYRFLFMDPNLAGKIFSFKENQGDGTMGSWKNYGGDKTWPAPQGWENERQWHGPPDPILDSGRYDTKVVECLDNEAIVMMISQPDPRTGIQITRQVTLQQGNSRAILDLSFTNIFDHQIQWSIWDVAQLRAERSQPDGSLSPESNCVVTAPLNPHSCFPKGFNVMAGDENNPQWGVDTEKQLFIGQYMREIGKVGVDSPGGWIAFSNSTEGYAFVEQFPYYPEKEYPDQGATVECWTTGRGTVQNLNYENSQIYLMETEVLSPLFTFEPGETRSFQIVWGVCRSEGPVIDANEAGCVHQPLIVIQTGAGFELSGSFGVFHLGVIKLVYQDRNGKTLRVELQEEVSPVDSIIINRSIQPSSQAVQMALQLLPKGSNSPLTLAKCPIQINN